MSRINVTIIILATFFAACGKDDLKQPVDNNGFFPNNATNNDSNNGTTNNNGFTNNGTQSNNGTTNNNVTLPYNNDVDILWVVDNSGSMCQEQEILRDNFKSFAEKMAETKKNFHLAVTTTHMLANYPLEPVARPGHIQSTPQPIPGIDRTCVQTVDDNGDPVPGEYTAVRVAIKAALACSDIPQPRLETLTDEEIGCAYEGQRCSIQGLCGENGERCSLGDLFPDPATYRTIPKVLRAEDYQNNGALDVEKLVSDFNCMSFVGTRGHGIEKGLAAIVEATKPDLTGGSVESPTDPTAPNHGFLRKDSEFAVAFLTDENDCTHDGGIDEASTCGDAVCEYANIEGATNSPLVKIEDIKSELISNLRASKGNPNFDERAIRVASLHGKPERFSGPVKDACPANESTGVVPVCAGLTGVAFSGDRYSRFLSAFDAAQTFPTQADQVQGWICQPGFGMGVESIGELFAR